MFKSVRRSEEQLPLFGFHNELALPIRPRWIFLINMTALNKNARRFVFSFNGKSFSNAAMAASTGDSNRG